MPLNILWGYVSLEHVDETPHIFYWLWFLGSVGTFLTCLFTLWHFMHNHLHLLRVLDDEGHAITPFSVQMQQTVSAFPVFTAGLAYLCLFVPAASYSMELCIAIFASSVMGSLTQYFLHALGPPPGPEVLTRDLPKMRWWCYACCGGVNDAFGVMGLFWSREPHHLTLRDLRCGFRMVDFFTWTFIALSAVNMAWSVVPRAVVLGADGWCYSLSWMKDILELFILIFSVLATLVGSAGLQVVTAAVAMSLGEDDPATTEERKIHVRKKACTGQLYVQLPLLKVLLSFIRASYASPTISVPVTELVKATSVPDGTWETHGRYISCPIYDQQVMLPMFYCTLVTLFMAYISYSNFALYVPSDRNATKLLRKKLEDRLQLEEERLQDPHSGNGDLNGDESSEYEHEPLLTESGPSLRGPRRLWSTA
eukprot:TRINITY_DN29261_c0_g1_i1.p1 TRINITY_DN29261_c0_g1~~TRINITY_DN29261_c0_g1_i1.p1  ORF type:complete len:447 (+),score=67.79 TRINITY_DN29261_c0_g1_i1:73-1341(+)